MTPNNKNARKASPSDGSQPSRLWRNRILRRVLAFLFLSALVMSAASPAYCQGFLRGIVGLRVTVTDTRTGTNEVDFDVTAFTQHRDGTLGGPPGGTPVRIGHTFLRDNRPAIDFGDGSRIDLTTLPLESISAGLGGSHVYRRSFTHSYPSQGSYQLAVASRCAGLSSVKYYQFQTNAPSVTTSYFLSPKPPKPTGNVLFANTVTSTFTFPPTILRRILYNCVTMTNNTQVILQGVVPDIPTLSTPLLILLGVSLVSSGFLVLRSFRLG